MSQSPNRILATILGASYLLLGLIGFTATSGVAFFATTGGRLFGMFELNIAQNVLHLVIGAVLIIGGISNVTAARIINLIIGMVFLALGIAGLFLVGSDLNILAINAADNVLHFASAVILLAAGVGADKVVVRPTAAKPKK